MGAEQSKPKRKPIYEQNTPSPLKNTTGKFPGLIDAVKKEALFGKSGTMTHVKKIFNNTKYNNKKELQELLDKKDMEGRTALDWAKTLAETFDRPDIVKYLEKKREEVEETTNPEGGVRGGSRTRRKGKKSA
jgi:hypothetical protein